jgi:hypothetical protein
VNNISLTCNTGRPSAPLPLRSDFGDVPGFSKLDFIFAAVSVAPDGTVKIEWPTLDQSPVLKCLLQDKPFDHGKTKVVHKVLFDCSNLFVLLIAIQIILDGLPWVAKRFFNIGAGENQVDIQENRDQIVMEATRLARATYFVERFLAEARRKDVDVEHGTPLGLFLLQGLHIWDFEPGIQVTDFKLGMEVVQTSGPSVASGFSLEQYQAAQDVQPPVDSDDTASASDSDRGPGIVVWLCEPRRSSKVQHWSGTNEYPSWERNKLGSTLNAFAHYAYIFSHESTVFCDLQSESFILLPPF